MATRRLLDEITRTFRALSRPLGLRIFMLLRKRGALSGGEIVGSLKAPTVSQPTVSDTLRSMKKEGLLVARRQGRMTTYAVRPGVLDTMENAYALIQHVEERVLSGGTLGDKVLEGEEESEKRK